VNEAPPIGPGAVSPEGGSPPPLFETERVVFSAVCLMAMPRAGARIGRRSTRSAYFIRLFEVRRCQLGDALIGRCHAPAKGADYVFRRLFNGHASRGRAYWPTILLDQPISGASK
jgi:hypothetical protein